MITGVENDDKLNSLTQKSTQIFAFVSWDTTVLVLQATNYYYWDESIWETVYL